MLRTSGLFLPVPIQASIKDGESFLAFAYSFIVVKCHVSKEAECALGSIGSPSSLRVGSREEANQIFVDEYMRRQVARFK